ncbi:hypothetical protein C2845_PM17G03470 [Panicum miliaceum]|uniref:Uncharacterized protein n=1 Tax=Panicum miliaceum TaxID=4540 RepID=A0A3L6Q0S9_PANMI|nr:hypothetical protein C2845_PM17G03470 [Panicum miliaceum]
MPDPVAPKFPGLMVKSTSIRRSTTIQSVPRDMIQRVIARFWDTKFKGTRYRMISRILPITLDDEDTLRDIPLTPRNGSEEDHDVIRTTGAYLYRTDYQLMDVKWENHQLHEELATCTR